jgi:ketosteroid isomerase-like protein
MPEEPSTPAAVDLVREQVEALDRGDLDGVMSNVAEDIVFDGRAAGDHFEGRAAIRGFLEDWFRAWEELSFELEEIRHVSGGTVFAIVIQDGRLVGSGGHLRQREGWVYFCGGGSITRLTISGVDEARAAAERLAMGRGDEVSEEPETVSSPCSDSAAMSGAATRRSTDRDLGHESG